MPVPIIQVPGLSHTPLNQASPSAAAAAAPAQALGDLAEGIASISEPFARVAGRLQQAENVRQLSEARSALDLARTDHLIELQKVQDPAEHLRLTDDFLQRSRDIIDRPDFSPVVRDRLVPYHDQWATDTRNRVAAGAADLGIRRSTLARENAVKLAYQNNDPVLLESTLQDDPFILPEQADAIRADYNAKQADDAELRDIHEEPAEWLEQNPQPPANGDLGKWKRRQDLATHLLREQTTQAFDDIKDGMANGSITTPEQIEELSQDLRPAVREQLQAMLETRISGQLEAQRNSPEAQEALTASLHDAISSYDPQASGFDEDLVAIESAMEGLANGPTRDMFAEQIKELRAGKQLEIRTVRDAAFKQLDNLREAGGFGHPSPPKPRQFTAGKFAADGYFENIDNLQSLGISEADAKKIAKAETLADRISLFRDIYPDAEGEVTADPFVRKVADHFRDSASMTTVLAEEQDPGALDQYGESLTTADSRFAKAHNELAQWFAVTKEPTIEQATEKLRSVGVTVKAASLKSSIVKPRPQAISPETSMNLPAPLAPLAPAFQKYGEQYGVDPRFLAAISQLETARGTSSAFRRKRNAMGVSNSSGPIAFPTPEASIARMARVLADPKGPYRNATTLAEIAKVYAPPGAGNDPNGTNSYWPQGVAKYLREMGVDPATTPLVTRES